MVTDVNYHGSVLLQHLLSFNNPKVIVNGLVTLKSAELYKVSCNPCGSHVIDKFFQVAKVGEKSRDSMINKMKVRDIRYC